MAKLIEKLLQPLEHERKLHKEHQQRHYQPQPDLHTAGADEEKTAEEHLQSGTGKQAMFLPVAIHSVHCFGDRQRSHLIKQQQQSNEEGKTGNVNRSEQKGNRVRALIRW